MKKLGIISAVLLICCCLGVSFGYAAPTPATIELKSSHEYPVAPYQMDVNHRIFKEVIEKRTNGRVKLTIYPMGQLFLAKEEIAACSLGNVDVVTTPNVYLAGKAPAYNIFEIPRVFDDEEHLLRFYKATYGVFSQIWAEKEIKYLGQTHQSYYGVWNNKRPLTKMEDWKGLKMRCGGTMKLCLERWGASGILIPSSEMLSALSQGMIDGLVVSPSWVGDNKAVTNYGTSPFKYLFYHSVPLFMSMKTWNRLPADIQNIIQAEVVPEFEKLSLKSYREATENCYKQVEKAGTKLSWFEAGELDKMIKAIQPLVEEKVREWKGSDVLYKIILQTK